MSNLIGVNSPIRLLREQWGSPKELAEELYAMFTARGPAEIHDTLTIRVPQGRPALRIERQQDGDTFVTEIRHGAISKASVATAPNVPGRRAAPRPGDDARRPGTAGYDPGPARRQGERQRPASEAGGRPVAESPLVEIDGPVKFSGPAPVQFSQPPVFVNEQGFATDLASEVARRSGLQPDFSGGSTGTGNLMGVVQDGRGDTYEVLLYPNGPGSRAGDTVTVKIPQIAPDEVIEPGTWLSAIGKYKDGYWCQPPVWLI